MSDVERPDPYATWSAALDLLGTSIDDQARRLSEIEAGLTGSGDAPTEAVGPVVIVDLRDRGLDGTSMSADDARRAVAARARLDELIRQAAQVADELAARRRSVPVSARGEAMRARRTATFDRRM